GVHLGEGDRQRGLGGRLAVEREDERPFRCGRRPILRRHRFGSVSAHVATRRATLVPAAICREHVGPRLHHPGRWTAGTTLHVRGSPLESGAAAGGRTGGTPWCTPLTGRRRRGARSASKPKP